MNRLAEMNSKSPFVKAKPEVKVEKPKPEPRNDEREKEVKQLKALIAKSEKEIERLENEINSFDQKMSDPEQYQLLMNDKPAFANYEQMKKQLQKEMESWEELQERLE